RLHEGGIEALEAYLTAYNDCRLVTVDTLARVKPRLKRGADAYEHEMAIGGQLQALAQKYHVCLLVVHHTRKSKSETGDFIDELSGSTGITGAPDFVAQLSRGRRENTGILEITGKDIPEIELALKFEDCQWTLLGNAQIVKLSEQRLKILEVLRQAGKALAPKQIAELSNLSYDSCKHLISKLFDDGYIEPDGYGKYKIKI
ncbi:MAG: AAA family ATPase, partial [Candidatus Thermoplasmatota archaeon]|nr:AAA family ATPase [Candidatus Thermoplasmatota archaeon]